MAYHYNKKIQMITAAMLKWSNVKFKAMKVQTREAQEESESICQLPQTSYNIDQYPA